jgi:hypothetical protein
VPVVFNKLWKTSSCLVVSAEVFINVHLVTEFVRLCSYDQPLFFIETHCVLKVKLSLCFFLN